MESKDARWAPCPQRLASKSVKRRISWAGSSLLVSGLFWPANKYSINNQPPAKHWGPSSDRTEDMALVLMELVPGAMHMHPYTYAIHVTDQIITGGGRGMGAWISWSQVDKHQRQSRITQDPSREVAFHWSGLLRYKSHTITFPLLKCPNWWFLIYLQGWAIITPMNSSLH